VYRAKDATTDLLSPAAFQQVCELEGQVLAARGYNAACRAGEGSGCTLTNGGACLAPLSATSALRSATPGGWSMSCAELVADPAVLQGLVSSAASCLGDASSEGECEGVSLLGYDFTAKSPSTRLLSALFPFNEWSATDSLIRLHRDGAIASSADVETAYGDHNNEFYDAVMNELLVADMALVMSSMGVSLLFLLGYTRSLLMSFVGLVQVSLSFPVAFFLYKLVFGFSFFPFLNFLALFVIMGIGVDDLFVVIDKWHQAVLRLPPDAPVPTIAAAVGPDAALTMLLTSLTTAAAFFATCLVPVAPIRLFALFMGFLVLADYALCLFISFPAACLQHRWLTAARRSQNRCAIALLDFASCCQHGASAGGATPVSAVEKPKRLDRLMTGPVHTAVYKGRFVLIALFTTSIGLCGWQASVIPLPSSSQVKLLPDAHVAQKFREWHNDLRSSGNDNSWTSVVWGLEPGDTGDVFDPLKLTKLLADRSFDPSSEVAQEWLLAFCNTTRAAGFTMAGYGCVLRDIQEWLARRVADDEYDPCGGALALPIVPARFHACVAAWSENECGVGETGWCDGVAMYRGRLVVLVFSFQVGIRWDSSYEKLRSMVGQWEGWMGEQNGAAPAGVSRGYFTSGEFHWWDTNRSMLEGAYLSIMTALIVVSAAVLTSTLNLLTTLYAIVSVCAVLLLVIGTVVGMGWELGFLEGICFAILIGLSCDFVLHMAHAYQASAELTRQDKRQVARRPHAHGAADLRRCAHHRSNRRRHVRLHRPVLSALWYHTAPLDGVCDPHRRFLLPRPHQCRRPAEALRQPRAPLFAVQRARLSRPRKAQRKSRSRPRRYQGMRA
jgi:hypothetical protein